MGGPRPEVLAPGGSLEAIEVALTQGADAIYAGVGSLNARVRARNLAPEVLPAVARTCHEAGARLYVTLNVPLRQEALGEACRVLAACHLAGVDGVILRDVALMRLCREAFPDLAVHASTQAGVRSVETARRAREAGCSRVILARECSREDIQRIRQALPDLELEVFVFGAMCFGVSGQCLLGEATSGRSGNYGACSQACRLPYRDARGQGVGHPFSMKDLDLLDHLEDLVHLGVAALKVEGRLKSPAWVGCVVAALRRALDRPRPGLTPGELVEFRREVSVLYARPRTDAWYRGDRRWGELVDPEAPGHRGCDVGEFRVRRTPDGPVVRFRTPVDLNLRDGLLLTVEDPERPSGRDFVPVAVTALADGDRRPCGRVAAGRFVEVPVAERRHLLAVAVHSSDGVRVRWSRVGRPLPATVRQGIPEPPCFEEVEVTSRQVRAVLVQGRLEREFTEALETEPARGESLSEVHLGRLFGKARYRVAPGLYGNPSHLKEVRRRLWARFREEADREVTRLASEAEARLRREWRPPVEDGDLLRRGPAAISRVTGMPPGVYRSPGGTRFQVQEQGATTVVRLVERGETLEIPIENDPTSG